MTHLWNLNKVQITLDGTEEMYNRSKAFIYKEGSPYLRVLNNIHRLLDAGIKVSIRLNINRHNADDLLVLTDTLINQFGGQKLLNVYSHPLFEANSEIGIVSRSDSQRQELFHARMLLQQKLKKGKIAQEGILPNQLKLNRCMADSDAHILILPDGHLGKCEHFSDDHWFGHLDTVERDETTLEDFKMLREEIDACTDCPFYPDCFRLTMCEETAHCYPEEREEQLLITRQNLLNFYRKKRDEVSD